MPTLKENLAVMNLAMELFNGSVGNISKVEFEPQKVKAPVFPPEESLYFKRVTPESVGVSSERVAAYIKELSENRKAAPHHLIMLRHGRVFAECSWAPYPRNTIHIEHSLAKSITSLAIGMLIDDDKLSADTRMTEVFGSKISFLNSLKLKNISVFNLLTMSSGIAFNESGAASGNDWLSAFFDSSLNFNTGTRFEYNSMNSYVLSAIVTEITGMPMDEFLSERLFNPLHIEDYLWERCPKGITKGGWGLFMKPEDVAKIGQLYLSGGFFEGKQIVSEEWITEATKAQIKTEREDGLSYGYQLWVNPSDGSYMFNGMLQQNCFVFRDNDMVIVTNSGSNELLTVSQVTEITRRYFGNGYKCSPFLEEDIHAYSALLSQISLAGNRPGKHRILYGGWGRNNDKKGGMIKSRLIRMINNRSYVLENRSEGLMPLFMQVVHNNFTEGISEISFEKDIEGIFVNIKEGKTVHHIAAGFFSDRYSTLDFKGEQYLLSAYARVSADEDGDICLIVETAFVEEACKRLIKIFFKDDFRRIKVELSEMPGEDVLLEAINTISDSEAANNGIMARIKDFGALEVFKRAASTKISPVIRGHIAESYDKIGENVLWARP